MARLTVTDTSKEAWTSIEGTQANPDSFSIRLAKGTSGTVWIERTYARTSPAVPTPATTTDSFYFTGTEVYTKEDCVAGDSFQVITDVDVDVVIDANETGNFGS